MSWGSPFASAWNAASGAAKQAAHAAAQTAESAYDYTAKKAVQSYEYAKEKVSQGIDYAADKVSRGYQQAKDAAGRAITSARGAVAAVERKAIDARYAQAQRAYGTNSACMSTDKAGGATQKCLLPQPTQCAKLKDALEKAQLSMDTYDVDPKACKMVAGYQRLDPIRDKDELRDRLGIDPADETLEPKKSDFRAVVYKRSTPDGKTEYVIGFRGTQTGADWRENAKQGSGFEKSLEQDPKSMSSYSRAMRLGKITSAVTEMNGDSVSFTGHSLGGGMASAASVVGNKPATTYNAAGLHKNTVGGEFPAESAQVDAYFTPTDPLSAAQDNRSLVLGGMVRAAGAVPIAGPLLATALGSWILGNELADTEVMPKAYGNRQVIPFPPDEPPPDLSLQGLKDAHGMELVIKGIKAQRKALGCK